MRKAKKSPNKGPEKNPDKSRGFRDIYGKTILRVNTRAINLATITFTDGTKFTISGDNWFMGIPVIECFKRKP